MIEQFMWFMVGLGIGVLLMTYAYWKGKKRMSDVIEGINDKYNQYTVPSKFIVTNKKGNIVEVSEWETMIPVKIVLKIIKKVKEC